MISVNKTRPLRSLSAYSHAQTQPLCTTSNNVPGTCNLDYDEQYETVTFLESTASYGPLPVISVAVIRVYDVI